MKEVVCRQCGRTFIAESWNASLCSDKCRRARQVQYNKESRERERERLKAGAVIYDGRRKQIETIKSTMSQLTNDAIEAKKRGMTYGKYIALVKERANRGI